MKKINILLVLLTLLSVIINFCSSDEKKYSESEVKDMIKEAIAEHDKQKSDNQLSNSIEKEATVEDETVDKKSDAVEKSTDEKKSEDNKEKNKAEKNVPLEKHEDTYYTRAEESNIIIRSLPTTKSKVVVSIPRGHKVNSFERTIKKYSIKGLEEYGENSWYRISTKYKGKRFEGYVWGGLLTSEKTSGNSETDKKSVSLKSSDKDFEGTWKMSLSENILSISKSGDYFYGKVKDIGNSVEGLEYEDYDVGQVVFRLKKARNNTYEGVQLIKSKKNKIDKKLINIKVKVKQHRADIEYLKPFDLDKSAKKYLSSELVELK